MGKKGKINSQRMGQGRVKILVCESSDLCGSDWRAGEWFAYLQRMVIELVRRG